MIKLGGDYPLESLNNNDETIFHPIIFKSSHLVEIMLFGIISSDNGYILTGKKKGGVFSYSFVLPSLTHMQMLIVGPYLYCHHDKTP